MTNEQKSWIDDADYETLLNRWRHGTIGDSMFQDETGDYYKKIMLEKKKALNSGEQVAASKSVGWG